MTKYSAEFYENNLRGSTLAGRAIIPLITSLFSPRSYLDVGCGTGTWLAIAENLGIPKVFGVDGAWAKSALVIRADQFEAIDLSKPFDLGRKFDVAASLEVAEHIAPEFADIFVSNMTKHADLVMFGAAAPFQGGTGHVNERWPAYWIEKFAAKGYDCFDIIRWKIWHNMDVAPWYAQNTFVFVNTGRADLMDMALKAGAPISVAEVLPVIHPQIWVWRATHMDSRIPDDVMVIVAAVKRMLGNLLRKLKLFPPKGPRTIGY